MSERQLIVTADDFGFDLAVNEGIERAHRDGIVTSTSLMVGEAAVDDAVERAHRLPKLAVGLHIVLVRGRPLSPPEEIPDLVARNGAFRSSLPVAFYTCFRRGVRPQLAREIRAQFERFAETGLALDHADVHCHFHLHPVVADLIVKIGRDFGLRSVRLPFEPPALLAGIEPAARFSLQARVAALLAKGLRDRLRREELATNNTLLGIEWSGAMTEARVLRLIDTLPTGVTELHAHPASKRSQALEAEQPGYRNAEELAALCSARVRGALEQKGIRLTTFGALSRA